MSVLLAFIVVSAYVLILVALAIYGLNFFYLTIVAPRVRSRLVEQPLPDRLPRITVQLPIYNEQLVAQRVIDAAAQLDWPRDRLEIQVLDDSTDVTRDIAAQAVLRWQLASMNIRHIHRVHRQGYKAGALAAGMPDITGEFIAIFDADFVPAPDFLRRTIGAFADPRVGFVQARWEHLNRGTSILTYLQALSIDGHFMIEQMARTGKHYVMNFNGTAGIWRRAAIEDAGGWNPGSLTEDLDLSYRAALRGWKPAYLPNVSVPSELVASMLAYRKQQTRWAQGSIETALHLMPVVLRSKLSPAAKIEALLHLTGYGIQLLMLAVSLLYPFLMTAQMPGTWHTLLLALGALLGPTVLAPPFLFLTAQRLLRPARWWRKIPGVLALSVLGTGMVLNNTRAIWRGLRSKRAVFERTPKSGSTGKESGPPKPVYKPHGDRLVFVEFCLAAWNLYTAYLAWSFHNPGIFINALLFAAGLSFVAGLTAWEMYAAHWNNLLASLLRPKPGTLRKDRSIRAIAPPARVQRTEDFRPGDIV